MKWNYKRGQCCPLLCERSEFMANKVDQYTDLMDETILKIVNDENEWKSFLHTAARLYKHDLANQLLIYAQKPDAIACATIKVWNYTMHRIVKRGTKGIALIDTSKNKPFLYYVFDWNDTENETLNGLKARNIFEWEINTENEEYIRYCLENKYSINHHDTFCKQIEVLATERLDYFFANNQEQTKNIINSQEIKPDELRNIILESVYEGIASRCNKELKDTFYETNYKGLNKLSDKDTFIYVGTAIHMIVDEIQREIILNLRNYERGVHIDDELYRDWRLHDSTNQIKRTTELGQMGTVTTELDKEEQSTSIQSIDDQHDLIATFIDDREQSKGNDTRIDGQQTDSLHDDRVEETSGTTDFEESDHEVEIQNDWNLFSYEEQKNLVGELENELQMTFPIRKFKQDEIDYILIHSSNKISSRLWVLSEYTKMKSHEEFTNFIKKIYKDGNGIIYENRKYAIWHCEDGIHMERGISSKNSPRAFVLSWEDAATRIAELIEQGIYANKDEVENYRDFEAKEIANSFWYFLGDLSDEAKEQKYFKFADTLRYNSKGVFSTDTELLKEKIQNKDSCQILLDEMRTFCDDMEQNPYLMRFRFYRNRDVLNRLEEYHIERKPIFSQIEQHDPCDYFITDDEINVLLAKGSNVSASKERICDYFLSNNTIQDKAKYLKNEYGLGGCHGAEIVGYNSFGKALEIEKNNCKKIELSWIEVTKRIDSLIKKGQFLPFDVIEKLKNEHEMKQIQENDIICEQEDLSDVEFEEYDDYAFEEYDDDMDI